MHIYKLSEFLRRLTQNSKKSTVFLTLRTITREGIIFIWCPLSFILVSKRVLTGAKSHGFYSLLEVTQVELKVIIFNAYLMDCVAQKSQG